MTLYHLCNNERTIKYTLCGAQNFVDTNKMDIGVLHHQKEM